MINDAAQHFFYVFKYLLDRILRLLTFWRSGSSDIKNVNMAAFGSLKAFVKRFVECRTASALRCLNVRNLQNVQIIGITRIALFLRTNYVCHGP